jgi:hypothetical protein
MKAIAKQSTKLTKDLVDSSYITDLSRVFLVHAGTQFELKAIAPQVNQGKRLCTVSGGLGPAHFNTWWLFPDHWSIKENPRDDYDEASHSAAAGESTPNPSKPNWHNQKNDKISRWFCERDVTNGDSRRIPTGGSEVYQNVMRMAAELDKIRDEWGQPIGVTSWYRPPRINAEVGGAQFSQHLNGGAADIYTLNGRDYEFEDFLDRHWGGGLGYGVASGRGFTHLDLREGGWRRGPGTIRWTY